MAPASMVVVVYEGDAQLGTAMADDAGRWQLALPQPLSKGEHSLFARTTDGERVSDPSNIVRITVLDALLPITGGE